MFVKAGKEAVLSRLITTESLKLAVETAAHTITPRSLVLSLLDLISVELLARTAEDVLAHRRCSTLYRTLI